MQYPAFVIPWLGNGMLIALDAVLHVVISHGFAIGAVAMIVLAEAIGIRRSNEDWDRFARSFLKALIIIVTGIGAPTGVGIWLTTSALAPKGIGSLLRVFFWPWLIEWLVFTAEVILILIYYFTWERWQQERKRRHLRIGVAYLSCALTSAFLITGILGFMLTPGGWLDGKGLAAAFFNASFLPQLLVRLGIAFTLGSIIAAAYAVFRRDDAGMRTEAMKLFGAIAAVSLCLTAFSSAWFLAVVPSRYTVHVPFALLTSRLANLPEVIPALLAIVGAGILLFSLAAYLGRLRQTRLLVLPALILAIFYVTAFERVREFIRGPYLMPGYLYANQLLLSESHLMGKEGMASVTPWYPALAAGGADEHGAFLFAQNCTACHTLRGINGIDLRVRGRSEDGLAVIIGRLHDMVPFMPPFSGNDEERRMLTRFLASLEGQQGKNSPSRFSPYTGRTP